MSDDIVNTNIQVSATDRTGQALSSVAENLRKVNAAAAGALTPQFTKAADAAKKAGDAVDQHIGGRAKNALSGVSVAAGAFAERLSGIPLGWAAAGVAVEEFARRSLTGFAQFQRGMESIQFETGATRQQIQRLGDTFENMAGQTGESIGQLQEAFSTFTATSGLGFEQAKKSFQDIGDAATVAGTSVEQMASAAGAAFSNLRITSDADRKQVVDAWATEVPSALIGAWTQAAPRLTRDMANVGITGARAGTDLAAVFSQVAASVGSPRLAVASLTELLQKMGDLSTPIGMSLRQTMQQIHNGTAAPIDAFRKLIDMVQQAGGFSESLSKQWMAMRYFDFDPATLRSLKAMRDTWAEIDKDVARTGEAGKETSRRLKIIGDDPLASLKRLGAEFDNIEGQFGSLMVTLGADKALKGVADTFRALADTIALVKDGLNWIGEHMPSGAPVSPAQAAAAQSIPGVGAVPTALGGLPNSAALLPGVLGLAAHLENAASGVHRFREWIEGTDKPGGKARPHMQAGGIVRGPTVAELGEGGAEEAVIPLTEDGLRTATRVFGDTAEPKEETRANTQATAENTNALNRLGTYLRDWGRSRRGFAFTPGAGGSATPAVAGLLPHWNAAGPGGIYESLGGGGGGGGGASDGAPSGGAPSSGGSWWQGIGPRLPGGSPMTGSPASGGVIGPDGGVAPGPHVTPQGVAPKAGSPDGASSAGGAQGGASVLDRSRFAAELKAKPWLRDKIMRIAANEQGNNPAGTQAVLESMMNRAAVRGTSLEAQATWHNPRTGAGYYQMGSMGRGALEDPAHRAMLEHSLSGALGGSNLSNYATDNASGALAADERASGSFRFRGKINGESFFAPGWGERGLAKRWDEWMDGSHGATAAAGGDSQFTGVGGYNFMGSVRARAMGMGDVSPGSSAAHETFRTGIPRGQGPETIRANKYAGPDMAGFLKDLHDAGAPLNNFSGVYANRSIRGGHRASQHAYGNAMDIETGFGSGPDNSPELYAWATAHPKEFAEIQARHHMRNLGAENHDWGHFEWTPTGRAPASDHQVNPHFKSMIEGHRAVMAEHEKLRKQMEKPIKINYAPSRPSAAAQRRQIANREARWRSDAMLSRDRYASQADLGVG